MKMMTPSQTRTYLAGSRIKIARHLRAMRETNGWTQEDLAALLNCSRTKLNRIENGRAELTASEVALVARAFRVSVKSFSVE